MAPPGKGKKKAVEPSAEETFCAICQSDIPADRSRAVLDCGHTFCGRHLQRWAQSENKCPTCRVRFTTCIKIHGVEKGKSPGKRRKRSIVHFTERTQRVSEDYLNDDEIDEEPQPPPAPQEEIIIPEEIDMPGAAPASPAEQGAAPGMPGQPALGHPMHGDGGLPVIEWYLQGGLQQPAPIRHTAAAQRAMALSRQQSRVRQENAEEADRQAARERSREEAERIRLANAAPEEQAHAMRAAHAEVRSLRARRAAEADAQVRAWRAGRAPPLAMPTVATPTARRDIASSEEARNRRADAARRRAMQAAAGAGPYRFVEAAPADWPGLPPDYAAAGADNNAPAAPYRRAVAPPPPEARASSPRSSAASPPAAGRPVEVAAEWPIVRPPYSADAAPAPPEPYPLASVEGLPLRSLSPLPANIPQVHSPRLRGERVNNFAVTTAAAGAAIADSVARERASPRLEPSSLDVFDQFVDRF